MSIPMGTWLSLLASILAVGVGLIRLKKLPLALRLLVLFLAVVLVNNIIVLYWAFLNINNMWLFHFFTLVEYTSLSWILSYWQPRSFFQKGIRWSILIFACIWLLAKFTFENMDSYDSVTATISHLLLIGYAALTLFELGQTAGEKFIFDARFWVSGAVLIYSTGSILWLALGNVIITWPEPQMMIAWTIHWILDIFTNILYMGGFLCSYRT